MQIIIEYVLIENLIINYFILTLSAQLFKIKAKFWFVSALFGSIMALFYPLFSFSLLIRIFSTILVSIVMVCISFPIKSFKDFLFYGFGFVFLFFVFGGACFMFVSWFGDLSTFIITLIVFVLFLCTKLFLRRLSKKRALQSFTCSVQIQSGGRVVEEIGYLDSANVLYDPVTSAPIVLISKKTFSKLVGEDYIYYLLKKDKIKKLPYGHFVNVGSAVSKGEMLVFMADKLIISEKGKAKSFDHTLLGLCLSDFSKTLNNSGVLLHSELAL